MKKVNKNTENNVNKNIKKAQSLRDKISTIEEIATQGMLKQKRLNKNLENYIARHEEKLIKELRKKVKKERDEQENRLLEEENEKRKELHYMKCPQCGTDLQEVKFMGTIVWACEKCLAICLNHGKLEHIIEKEAGFLYKIWNKTLLGKNITHPLKKKGSG